VLGLWGESDLGHYWPNITPTLNIAQTKLDRSSIKLYHRENNWAFGATNIYEYLSEN
jgi:hypothetical protein